MMRIVGVVGTAMGVCACMVLAVVAPGMAADAPVAAETGSPVLTLADGLEATLFAAEPLLSSPSDIDVDSRGRVWVCEVMNYRKKKDTRDEGDRILVLEDTDGDGKADRQTVFYQGRDVDSALGICVIGEGPGRKVIVSAAPDVFIFHDDDGDLKSDRRESLFTKVGTAQHDHSTHAFVVGPDGRWYFNFGNTGRAVHDTDGSPVRDRFGNEVNDSGKPFRQGMVFRCRPDGGDFEVLGHNFRNNYEVAVDSYGGLWQSDNDDDGNRSTRINWVMDYGNYGYVDERTGAGWRTARTNPESEVPRQHWHQNDPGVVPNMLLTGGGSPAGICVYEGDLLPERFRGAVLHCDPGPNVVRAYHVKPDGAGYTATMETIIDGSADKWFRPSDVCVAPDGSVIVADWHDPGVGGHGMADTEKGRIYRIRPRNSASPFAGSTAQGAVAAADVSTVAGAVAALASPNLCTRAMALERLAAEPEAAHHELAKARGQATDQRLRARLAWAWGMLPGQGESVSEALAAETDEMQVVALRMRRLVKGDVIGLVEKLVSSPSVAVSRECAIALRGIAGERADRAWAELAARHRAGDRWELETLGIGADGGSGLAGPSQWDGRLRAWLAKVGDGWKTPAGREIVWRSRAAATPALVCELIADPAIATTESVALMRTLEFQDPGQTAAAVRTLAGSFAAPEEKLRVILPELVMRLDPADAADAGLARRIDEAAGYAAGSERLVDIAVRFGLTSRMPEILALAAAEGTSETLAALAVNAALDAGAGDSVKTTVAKGDPAALRLITAVGINGSGKARKLLTGMLAAPDVEAGLQTAVVRGLSLSRSGANDLIALARSGRLAGPLAQVAAVAIASCPWDDLKKAAGDVLPMPTSKGGEQLPAIDKLVRRKGDADRGKAVFHGVGTCAKCHVVGGEGKEVGPNLSGIGVKLSREAIYESILVPSAAISHNYEAWTALLADGRSMTGLLISRTPDEAVIRGLDGIDVTIAKDELEELVKQPVSLMPSDIVAVLSAEELVDLVAWLETLRVTN